MLVTMFMCISMTGDLKNKVDMYNVSVYCNDLRNKIVSYNVYGYCNEWLGI